MSSSDFERKIELEKLKKKSGNELVKKTASIISKDRSDSIIQGMRDEWKCLNKTSLKSEMEDKNNEI